ncbi:MAG: alpha-amylase family glycosyl hydrolase [Bacteroidetes bacterium]|nr:alpha-amylase family glycosyl hydrolase [Bacteroidota bacterium]
MELWKKNPVIYEINSWVWLGELSAQLNFPVTFGNVPYEKWDELAQLQIDAVWFMGVWERSPRGIAISNLNAGNLSDFRRALPDFTFADNVGSPYCIRRFVVDEHLGGNEGLAEARRQLARRGVKLILDFVPNHLAHDHAWVEEFPDYFIQGNKEDLRDDPITFVQIGGSIFACGKDPFYPAWQDVLQVNIFHPGLRGEAIETVAQISRQCDGVRCDMAMLVMTDIFEETWKKRAGSRPELEYWEELIPAVKRVNRDFIFIAEAYWDKEWALQRQGFDYCYDKRLNDRLANDSAADIRLHLTADNNYQSKLIRFIENHDEPRHVTVFKPEKVQAAAIISSTLPGARLFHEGQFEGRRVRLPVFLQRRPDEPVDEDLHDFYYRLLSVIRNPVFRKGYWQLCERYGWHDNENYISLLAWRWCDGDNLFLVVVNYSDQPAQGRVRLPGNDLRGRNWRLNDAMSEITFERNGDEMHGEGLYVALAPWKSHLFRFFMV